MANTITKSERDNLNAAATKLVDGGVNRQTAIKILMQIFECSKDRATRAHGKAIRQNNRPAAQPQPTKQRLSMVINPQAIITLQRLATETDSFPVSGPTAKPGQQVGAINRLLERIAERPDLVSYILEALKDD